MTLWRPHWAYDQFDLKDLKDPKGTLGAAESIHSIASADFPKQQPQIAKWVKKFRMKSDLLYSLENAMFNSGADSSEYDRIVAKWMDEHSSYVETLTR
nr:glycine betaine ABC transporter substrate-binding protein [uncultured Leifsonia sp.]